MSLRTRNFSPAVLTGYSRKRTCEFCMQEGMELEARQRDYGGQV